MPKCVECGRKSNLGALTVPLSNGRHGYLCSPACKDRWTEAIRREKALRRLMMF